MKKIGILTFHSVLNYGGMLQAYALNKYLNQKGFEAYTIDYESPDVMNMYKLINTDIRRLGIKQCTKGNVRKILNLKKNYKRKKSFNEFKNKYIRITKKIKNKEELVKELANYDYIITGSDQVWNKQLTGMDEDIYLLDLPLNKKVQKVSYAASIGNDQISNEELQKIDQILNDYKLISVRERTLGEKLESISNKEITTVLDPTLLLDKKHWLEVMSKNKRDEKYICVYMLQKNERILNIVNAFSKLLNLKVVQFDPKKIYENEMKSLYTSGPDEFLSTIYNADFVITNSFHGMVFSILLEKQFVAIPHTTRSSRQYNLLEILDLNNRMIKDEKDYKKYLEEKINYKDVKQELERIKKESIEFLRKMEL